MEKGRGLNEKWLEYLIFELFSDRKWSWTRSIAWWTTAGTGPRWTVDRASAVARRRTAGTAPRAWNLVAVEKEGGGNGGDPHQWQEGVAEGWK
jgi:hypothetical protein